MPEDILNNPSLMESAAQGTFDTQPDQFFFNFMGHSGKFFFKNDTAPGTNVILTAPHQDIKIETGGLFQSWTLTTPDGIEYVFGGPGNFETSTISSPDCEPEGQAPEQTYITSWYLSQIIHPHGDVITFEYGASTTYHISSITESKLFSTTLGSICECEAFLNNGSRHQYCSNLIETTGIYLKKIITSTGSAIFNHSSRFDLAGGVKLDQIIIYGQQNEELRHFDLNYDYFYSPGQTSFRYDLYGTAWADQSTFRNRLKLLSVTELDDNNSDSHPPYTFSYYEGGDYKLPPRFSYRQDHWGYTNDNDEATFLPDNNQVIHWVNGGDRSTHPEMVKAGMLKSLTYPTGGSTDFVYEAHGCGAIAHEGNEICPMMEDDNSALVSVSVADPATSIIDTFTVLTPQWVNIFSKAGIDGVPGDFAGIAEIKSEDGDLIYSAHIGEQLFEIHRWLEAGTYHIIIDVSSSEFATINVYWTDIVPDCDPNVAPITLDVGGVRIKKMTHHGGDVSMIKAYEYLQEDDFTRSSGILITDPRYDYALSTIVEQSSCGDNMPSGVPNYCGRECSFRGLSSTSKAHLGSTRGSHIGYTHVRVLDGENASNGSISNSYSFAADVGSLGFPFGPNTSYDWKRGHLLKQVTYDVSGQPKKTVINDYDFREGESVGNDKVTAYRIAFETANPICLPAPITYQSYEVMSQWIQLKSITEILDGVTKITSYEYNPNADHTNPVAMEFVNSDGKKHRTETDYAAEAAETLLEQKHMIAIPIKVRKLVDDQSGGGFQIVGGYRTGFSGVYPVDFYEILLGGQELLRGEISGYTDGYPNDFTRMGFPTEVYTWEDGLLRYKDYGGWQWGYQYDYNARLPISVTDIDGQVIGYDYDGFQRLKTIDQRNGNITADYTYQYANQGGTNQVKEVITYSDAPTQTMINQFDGLGRQKKFIHNQVVKDEKYYDQYGRVFSGNLPSRQFCQLHLRWFATEPGRNPDIPRWQCNNNSVWLRRELLQGHYHRRKRESYIR